MMLAKASRFETLHSHNDVWYKTHENMLPVLQHQNAGAKRQSFLNGLASCQYVRNDHRGKQNGLKENIHSHDTSTFNLYPYTTTHLQDILAEFMGLRGCFFLFYQHTRLFPHSYRTIVTLFLAIMSLYHLIST